MARTSELLCAETRALLGRFLEGELGPEERPSVERHIETCPSCASELESARRAFAALRDLPENERSRLREEALRELGLDEPPPSRRLWRTLALVLGFIIIFLWLRARHETPVPEIHIPETR
jgi:anti-sigma factor RsiW